MDPYFYLYDHHGEDRPHPNALHFKTSQFQKQLSHFLERYLHINSVANSSVNGEAHDKQSSRSPEYFNLPPFDVRSTSTDYYFDIELPGVTNKASIDIHWISSHIFVVEGETPRPPIPFDSQSNRKTNANGEPEKNDLVRCPGSGETGLEMRRTNSAVHQAQTNAARNHVPLDAVALAQERLAASSTFQPNLNDGEPQMIHGERSIGSYKRSFSVPCDMDVDVQETEATLEAGVLTVRVPRKKSQKGGTRLKVPVF